VYEKCILAVVCFALSCSLFADDDAFRSLVRGILAPPPEQQQSERAAPIPPPAPKVVKEYPFNPDYPNIYLGDNGSQKESIFIEMVMYGQSQQSQKHFVLISGKSSQGVFQKKMTFASLEELLHFQGIL